MRCRLAGKVAVVLGGGQQPGATIGNGRAAAVAFAREGAQVLVVDRHLPAAEDTVAEIREAGGTAAAHRADVTRPDDCDGIVSTVLRVFGSIDVVHNNVGVVIASPTEETAVEDWNLGIELNLTGTWMVCKAFLPVLRRQGHGSVINISSLASIVSNASPYGIGKAGINALTRGLALEYAQYGVRVNAIIPGMIETPIGVDRVVAATSGNRDEIVAMRAAQVPMGYQGTAWDIANAAVFLASDESSYITGAILPVDGGAALRQSSF